MQSDPIAPFLASQGVLILDGGLATELEHRGADLSDHLWSARLLVDDPELIGDVHRAYLMAGADCVTSASYQASFEGLARRGLSAAQAEGLLRLSVQLAIESRDRFWSASEAPPANRLRPLVAASVGPYGAMLADGSEYTGEYGLDGAELQSFHRRRLQILAAAGADLLAVETIPSLVEAEAIAGLLEEGQGPPAWMSFSCRDQGSLCDGTDIRQVLRAIEDCERILAVGVNCTSPHLLEGLLRRAREVTDKPLVAYPNSGEGWDAASRRWIEGDEALEPASGCPLWRRAGALLIGGCCRTRPADITRLRQALLG